MAADRPRGGGAAEGLAESRRAGRDFFLTAWCTASSRRILLMTFSRRAAVQMTRRVQRIGQKAFGARRAERWAEV
jgi:hypothetical protein